VNELARILLDNLYLDFQGALTMDEIRQCLRDDDSREARALLARLVEAKGVDDFIIVVADCLREHIRTGISVETVRAQLKAYSDA